MLCLPPIIADKFLKKIASGGVTPDKLNSFPTSEARRAYLEKIVGKEYAKPTNILIEKGLLLKNQQKGLITAIKKFTGLKEATKRDMVAKVERLDNALSDSEMFQRVNDLVDEKLGIHLTEAERKVITAKTAEMDEIYQKHFKDGMSKGEVRSNLPKEYWLKHRQLENYLTEQTPISWRSSSAVAEVAAITKTLRATFDLSYTLKQGAAYFGRKEWFKAFANIGKYVKGNDAIDNMVADIMSHRFGNEAVKRKRLLGLTVLGEKMTQREEAFLSTLATKIPGVKLSERAVVGFINDLRANRFLNTLEAFDKIGKPLSAKEMDQLAQTIASATGRGTLGVLESAAKPLSLGLFSARFFAGRVITLLKPFQPGLSKVARIEASKNLGTLIGLTTGMILLAKAAGADVELDPRSSDFGKGKFGNVKFDLTAGYGQFVVLMARIFSQKSKSTTTGKISEIGTGDWGSQDTWDLLTGFVENKTAPLLSVLKEILKGETFGGEPINMDGPTLLYIASQLTVPMIAAQTYESYKQSGGDWGITAATFGAEFLGIGVNAYGYKPTTKEWVQLKEKRGDAVYEQAALELNQAIATRRAEIEKLPAYGSYDFSEQNKIIDTYITQESSKILDKYDIEMKAPTDKAEGVKLLKAVEKGTLGDWSDDGSFLDDLVLYARAIGTDPMTAFQRIITKQKIRRIDNGAIIVYRIPQSVSARVRKELGAGDNEELDHIIPLELGGSNSRSNLRLVSKAKHSEYTDVDNYLAQKLRAGKITKTEAQRRSRDFKDGKITKSSAMR